MSAAEQVPAAGQQAEIMRHSASHVMAAAVLEMFPDAKFGIGPAIANGFYYDFELPRALTPDDLPDIESRMKKMVKAKQPFTRDEISLDEARKLFASQPYKLELIDDIAATGDSRVSIYRQGDFTDLCRGPHVEHTGRIGAFKLQSIAGAYWRGDEHRPMLQRIYAAAFPDKAELKAYLEKIEEAARRDHRKLGKDLDLYSMHDEVGPGLALWHPKGGTVRRIIEDFWRTEHVRRGYDIVFSPHIARSDLWRISGHLENYNENMYNPIDIDEQQYIIKPMNCVYHILIYQYKVRSYRELPLRYAELGTVYRYERSGVLHGLSRVRAFTQDDAHIFCRPDQLNDEINATIDLALYMTRVFGFEKFKVMLSTRPGKAVGSQEVWDMATDILRRSLDESGLEYEVDEGGGAFYGPKIDIKFEDAQERLWQGPTIQVDFNLPERFDVNYIGEDGAEHRVVMVHRTVLGSMERYMATLVEHYGGAFPVWLAPVQAAVITVADRHLEYGAQLTQQLREADIRVQLDDRSDRINHKIRQAQLEKIPYMLVVGDREVESQTVAVRLRSGEQLEPMSTADFIAMVQANVAARSLELK